MCGVVGVVSKSEVSPMIYDALTVLQHRGQDAAGIATCNQDKFHLRKQLGLVRDVFRDTHMIGLRGSMGIGHLRYPTTEAKTENWLSLCMSTRLMESVFLIMVT